MWLTAAQFQLPAVTSHLQPLQLHYSQLRRSRLHSFHLLIMCFLLQWFPLSIYLGLYSTSLSLPHSLSFYSFSSQSAESAHIPAHSNEQWGGNWCNEFRTIFGLRPLTLRFSFRRRAFMQNICKFKCNFFFCLPHALRPSFLKSNPSWSWGDYSDITFEKNAALCGMCRK